MKYGKWIADGIFAICTFIFWRVRYPYALTYQEQFQMFLWDDDYFWGRMAEPGGLARWVAECLVQCYNNVTVGAIILTIIFLMIQQLTWKLMKKESPLSYNSTSNGNKSEGLTFFYAFSFIPVFACGFRWGMRIRCSPSLCRCFLPCWLCGTTPIRSSEHGNDTSISF